jgi:hypothetical protein
VVPAERFEGRGILIGRPAADELSTSAGGRFPVVRDLAAAVGIILPLRFSHRERLVNRPLPCRPGPD